MFSPTPSQADFSTFLYQVVEIPAVCLPTNSPQIGYAYQSAMGVVPASSAAYLGGGYSLSIYNLGADNLINYGVDQPGQTWFQDTRKAYGINLFVPGVVSSTSDASTSTSRNNPDWTKGLLLQDLQNLKTPYGRAYMAMAMKQGTLWGIS